VKKDAALLSETEEKHSGWNKMADASDQ